MMGPKVFRSQSKYIPNGKTVDDVCGLYSIITGATMNSRGCGNGTLITAATSRGNEVLQGDKATD